MRVNRATVDLGGYPDLVVVYLGMRVHRVRGMLRLLGVGPKLYSSHREGPEGLLSHEDVIWSLFPPHWGARQYWRDLDSLERWTRSAPHRDWWQQFLKDSGGTGFWHEAYFLRGGIDAVYDDMAPDIGLTRFAPVVPARGRMFSTRGRIQDAPPKVAPVVSETAYYPAESE
ncbi:monooxygenase family protein [Nocardia sp. NPDC052566]|uniref:monooxygenase family protein n=1 Tax=Nocardia sp. NPDC052566 TaxID=3364330 RepID=UPI0037CB9C9E